MMTGAITDDGAKAIAAFIRTIRPDWDIAGIRPALSAARHRAPAHELAIAAIRCAMGDARTPAVIAMDGPHWAGLVEAARTVRPGDRPRCPTHMVFLSATGVCSSCEADRKAGAPYTPAPPPTAIELDERARLADIARQALAEARNAIHLGAGSGVAQDEQTPSRTTDTEEKP